MKYKKIIRGEFGKEKKDAEEKFPFLKKPNFFIVGAPKCGTASMVEYLRQHPDVFMPRGEPHFFGSDIHIKRLMKKDYLDCFSEAKDEKRVGEKSNGYLRSKKAAKEIKEFLNK